MPVGWKGSTSNGQRDNCYPDGEGLKRHPIAPCDFSEFWALLTKRNIFAHFSSIDARWMEGINQ